MPLERFQGADADVFGHHFLVCLEGPSLTEDESYLLGALKPLGFVLTPANLLSDVSPAEQCAALRQLIDQFRELTQRETPVIASPHEMSCVLPAPFPAWPTCDGYAQRAGAIGRAVGEELRSLGVNLCIGPACNVAWSHDPAVLPSFSFAGLTEEVTTSAAAFLQGLQATGLACAPSAFPGDGGVAKRPGTPTPRLDETVDSIKMRDLPPFLALIELGVPAIAVSTALFAAIDRDYPACLSELTVNRLLRQRLKFGGITVTGDLASPELRSGILDGEIAARALGSTGDVFIVSELPFALTIAQQMHDVARLGMVSAALLDASFARLDDFVSTVMPAAPAALSSDLLAAHQALRASLDGER